MATDRGCPECHGTLVVRFDDTEVACPFHGDAALVQMDSEASKEIRERILEHARRNPLGQLSPEPHSWRTTAVDPARSGRGLGRLLLVVCALIVATVVVWAVTS